MWQFVLILTLVNVVLFGVIVILYRKVRQQASNLEGLTEELYHAAESVPEDAPDVLQGAPADGEIPGSQESEKGGAQEAEADSATP